MYLIHIVRVETQCLWVDIKCGTILFITSEVMYNIMSYFPCCKDTWFHQHATCVKNMNNISSKFDLYSIFYCYVTFSTLPYYYIHMFHILQSWQTLLTFNSLKVCQVREWEAHIWYRHIGKPPRIWIKSYMIKYKTGFWNVGNIDMHLQFPFIHPTNIRGL